MAFLSFFIHFLCYSPLLLFLLSGAMACKLIFYWLALFSFQRIIEIWISNVQALIKTHRLIQRLNHSMRRDTQNPTKILFRLIWHGKGTTIYLSNTLIVKSLFISSNYCTFLSGGKRPRLNRSFFLFTEKYVEGEHLYININDIHLTLCSSSVISTNLTKSTSSYRTRGLYSPSPWDFDGFDGRELHWTGLTE